MRMSKKQRKRKKKERMKNKRLMKKYYWLQPYDWWGRPIPPKQHKYKYINWIDYPGWNKAFGDVYMEELGNAIEEDGNKNFAIYEIKEKFAQLRVYTSAASQKVNEIIEKYEYISSNICMDCGREAPVIEEGRWLMVMCQDCYVKYFKRREKYCSDKKITSTEEIIKRYREMICDTPNEDGSWLPNSYSYKRFSKDGNQIITVDISDTVEKIRARQKIWMGYKHE